MSFVKINKNITVFLFLTNAFFSVHAGNLFQTGSDAQGTSFQQEDEPKSSESIPWYRKINDKIGSKNTMLIGAGAVALAACTVAHLIVTPFLVSAVGGFAAEQQCIKDIIGETAKSLQLDKIRLRRPSGVTDGSYDGLVYFGLNSIFGMWWYRWPVYTGLALGQAIAIGIDNPQYCREIGYALQSLRFKRQASSNQPLGDDSAQVSGQSDLEVRKEMINRASTALLTWACCAGLASKIGGLKKLFM